MPVGGGLGRLVRFGKQPFDFESQLFYYVEDPPDVGDWFFQFQVKWLFPHFVTDDLQRRGYPVQRSPFSYVFAGVHGIRIRDGKWDGGADPGRDGMALAV